MRREKQTNTSVVYVSTQKQRHKLNILRALKLADCKIQDSDTGKSGTVEHTTSRSQEAGPGVVS